VRQQQDAVAALETTAKKAAPPPAKAVARFASADAAGSAFTYAVTGSTVRVTSPANGFFQVASRSTAQTITSAARRANRGEAIDFPLPSGARSIVITFAANEAALNSQGPAGQTVVDSRRERSGSVPLPANAEKVSVEISVQ
jgi:hypothetical protein